MMVDDAARRSLREDLRRIATETRKFGYFPSRFIQDLSTSDPVELISRYVVAPTVSSGFTRLFQAGRLDLSVENVAWRYRRIFSPEVAAAARKRLTDARFIVTEEDALTAEPAKGPVPGRPKTARESYRIGGRVYSADALLIPRVQHNPCQKQLRNRFQAILDGRCRTIRQYVEFEFGLGLKSVKQNHDLFHFSVTHPYLRIVEPPDYQRELHVAIHPTADRAELRERTVRLLAEPLLPTPVEGPGPRRVQSQVDQFVRSPLVAAIALRRADGRCQLCNEPAPFMTADSRPYLEVHHVHRLADGGPDTPHNTVALCPNCHRRLHYSRDADSALAQLRQRNSHLAPDN